LFELAGTAGTARRFKRTKSGGNPMRVALAAAALVAGLTLAAPVFVLAQGAPQTVQLTKVDVVKVATGYRASKVIGSSVVNEANDTVGKIDDIIIGQGGRSPFVVLSVGGFLGIGTKLIVLPYEQLKTTGGKIVLPGATKDALKDLPEFKYASS
jgi:hypothetical protein